MATRFDFARPLAPRSPEIEYVSLQPEDAPGFVYVDEEADPYVDQEGSSYQVAPVSS